MDNKLKQSDKSINFHNIEKDISVYGNKNSDIETVKELEFVIGVLDISSGKVIRVISPNLDVFYIKDSLLFGSRRVKVTNLKGSMKNIGLQETVSSIYHTIISIASNNIRFPNLSFKVYLLENQNINDLNDYKQCIVDTLNHINSSPKLRLSIDTEILNDSFAPILGTSDGNYNNGLDQDENIYNNTIRANNLLSYFKNDCKDVGKVIDYIRTKDNPLFKTMLEVPEILNICKSKNISIDADISAEVNNIADIAIKANHRM
ncbi:MAG: hypothetical protein WC121_03525 [Candidatus Kapaibacterium sp.]